MARGEYGYFPVRRGGQMNPPPKQSLNGAPSDRRFTSVTRAAKRESSFPSEDFFQQRCRLSGRVLANFGLLLSQHMEEPIQGFADYIFVQIELTGKSAAPRGGFYQLVVLLNNSNAPHGAMNDRRERRGKVGGAASFKILGRGGVTSGQAAPAIVERRL